MGPLLYLLNRDYQKTYANNMGTYQRGFVPLVVVLLLGLAVTAGGTAVFFSIQKPPAPAATAGGAATSTTSSLPPKELSETKETYQPTQTSTALIEASVSQSTTDTCENVAKQDIPKSPSLIGQILTLCQELEKPVLDSPEQRERWSEIEANIAEKKELLETVQSAQNRE